MSMPDKKHLLKKVRSFFALIGNGKNGLFPLTLSTPAEKNMRVTKIKGDSLSESPVVSRDTAAPVGEI